MKHSHDRPIIQGAWLVLPYETSKVRTYPSRRMETAEYREEEESGMRRVYFQQRGKLNKPVFQRNEEKAGRKRGKVLRGVLSAERTSRLGAGRVGADLRQDLAESRSNHLGRI